VTANLQLTFIDYKS